METLFTEKYIPTGKWSNSRQVIKPTGADASNSSRNSIKEENLGSSDEDNVDTEANTTINARDTAAGKIIMPHTF